MTVERSLLLQAVLLLYRLPITFWFFFVYKLHFVHCQSNGSNKVQVDIETIYVSISTSTLLLCYVRLFLFTSTNCPCAIPSAIFHTLSHSGAFKHITMFALKSDDVSTIISATIFPPTNRSTKNRAVCTWKG